MRLRRDPQRSKNPIDFHTILFSVNGGGLVPKIPAMESAALLLHLDDVTKRYEGLHGGPDVSVLSGLCLQVNPGESLSIIGPSGSGKSTLLNIIGTLDRATSGKVMLEKDDLSQLNEVQLAKIRNHKIGFIFQSHHLLPQCTVLENVLVPTLAQSGGSTSNHPEKRAQDLLKEVGLDHRLDHRPGQLSGGERQRVAVVRALINQPKLLLADEPTGALDRKTAQELGQLLVDLNREKGVTLIVVTHALDLARQMGRVLELEDGRLEPSSNSLSKS
jgi:lipoprotein-releasing system ATP-binding protein